jgi:hypothetical protein
LLYTSYLAFFNRKETHKTMSWIDSSIDKKWDNVFRESNCFELLFVMRGRGNNPVEPPEMVFRLAKEGAITWEGYREAYLASLETEESRVWMQQTAKKAFDHHVVLVCYEKNPTFCHRRLLAEYIRDDFGVAYGGEL